MFCTYTQNPLKIHFNRFVFSRAASLQPTTLLQNELLHEHFSRVLDASAENLLKKALGGCFCMKAPKSYRTECFSVDTFGKERTVGIFFCSI